jgi:hypothetical protein
MAKIITFEGVAINQEHVTFVSGLTHADNAQNGGTPYWYVRFIDGFEWRYKIKSSEEELLRKREELLRLLTT